MYLWCGCVCYLLQCNHTKSCPWWDLILTVNHCQLLTKKSLKLQSIWVFADIFNNILGLKKKKYWTVFESKVETFFFTTNQIYLSLSLLVSLLNFIIIPTPGLCVHFWLTGGFIHLLQPERSLPCFQTLAKGQAGTV